MEEETDILNCGIDFKYIIVNLDVDLIHLL